MLIQLQVKQAGPARNDSLMGRACRVFPAVLVREQVLHNNLGACFLPGEEIKASVDAWNHTPVVIRHPTSRGEPVSARSPDVLNARGVGWVFNAGWDEGRRALTGEIWIDIGLAAEVQDAEPVVNRVEKGDPGELSTGFGTRAEQNEGVWEGESFDLVLRGVDPDHLALLVEEKGACSVEDGCGFGINVRSEARTPSFSGTEDSDWSAPTLEDFVSALGFEDVETVDDLTAEQKSTIADHTLLGEADAETFDNLSFFPVVNPSTGSLNRNALLAVISGRGAQADIPEEARDSAQTRARSLLEEEFDLENDAENQGQNPQDEVLDGDKAFNRFRTWMSRFFGFNQSDSDKREFLHQAIVDAFGGTDVHIWVVDVFSDDGNVVFERDGPMESGLFRVSFEIDDETNAVTLGEPVEVRRHTTFEPVSVEDDTAGNVERSNQEDDVDRNAVIAQLAERSPLREESLQAMSDEELEALQAAYPEEHEGDDGAGSGDVEAEGDQSADDDADDSQNVAKAINRLLDELKETRERVDNLESVAAPTIAEQKRERETLVDTLAANDRCPFEKQELEGMGIDGLRKLAQMARVNTYVGRGGPKAHQSKNDEPSYMPIRPYYETADNAEED